MRRIRIIAVGLIAAVAALGGPATSSAHGPPSGPPDTSVAAWDAIGTQAFSAAALTPAEGHVIFGYVAVGVYDSVVAIKGGYEPFAVDVRAPRGASAEAAVAAAAHRILVHYLPAQGPTILDPAYDGLAGRVSGRLGQDEGRRGRRRGRRASHRKARRRRLPSRR